ncbi:MAG: DUF2505 family protein [Deltaproteobacteria bacterium]|nr:DUF2505 family protein [Deltaproteobacteria bacterium]
MPLEHVITLPFPVDRVVELICSERYNLEVQQAREEVIEAHYERQAEDDAELRYEVNCTAYKRTMKGSIDRRSTEQFKVTYRYDKAARQLKWQHHGEESHRADVHGVTRFVAEGKGARVQREVTIDIRIPLIGRAVAKLIEREMKKGFDEVERRIRRMLAET